MSKKTLPLSIRIPTDLKNQLEREADAEARRTGYAVSVTQYVVRLLERRRESKPVGSVIRK